MIKSIQPNYFISFQGRKPKYTDREKTLAMRFEAEGMTADDAKKILNRFSKLKGTPLYTMEYNIREFARLHEEDGLTVKQHLEAAKRQPSLFASLPETLSNNVNDLHKFVSKYGFTKRQIIELQNKCPSLRAMSAKTLIHYMTDIPKRYKKSGLRQDEYVKMAMADIFLITVSPQRFENNINFLQKRYDDMGTTEKDLIKAFKKQRLLVTSSPENVSEKIDLWRYIEENKLNDAGKTMNKKEFKDLIFRKNLAHSVEADLLYLLRCKLNSYYGTNIPSKKMKEPIAKFIKEKSGQFIEIPVLEGRFVENFERVISDFSTKIINKNIFKVIVK